ncbi:MAG: transcription-repair coupling factor [Nitrospirae bacterium]|nr:MAG: transcription-repair coupling factor [Nitrospirota bacterium]
MNSLRDLLIESIRGLFLQLSYERSASFLDIYGFRGSSSSLFIHLAVENLQKGTGLVITPAEQTAREIYNDLLFWNAFLGGKRGVALIERGGTPEITGRRLRVLSRRNNPRKVVGDIEAFSYETWPPGEMESAVIKMKKGKEFSRVDLIERLITLGYRRVAIVSRQGEFSDRGWVLDIYPAGYEYPLRCEFFGDEIETLRRYDPETQRSQEELKEAEVLPAYDRPGTPVMEYFTDAEECYLIGFGDGWPEDLFGESSHFDRSLRLIDYTTEGERTAPFEPVSGFGFLPEEREDIFELPEILKGLDDRVLFVVETEAQAERLKEVCGEGGLPVPVVNIKRASSFEGRHAITVGSLGRGFRIGGLFVVTSNDLFGKRPSGFVRKKRTAGKILDKIEDLKQGDYVVHREHGIGRYLGLTRLNDADAGSEVILIEYAEGAKLYLPVQNVGLISKYRATEGVIPPLDHLGSLKWKKRRAKAEKRVKELARKLISLYAEREITEGFAFSPDTDLHREFEVFFPFEETPDQAKAWEKVREAMELPRPVDILICGDVGFGKTEIAMRAAFKAVYDAKQVAILVPTTILAEQHYRNFKHRFSAFPVRIDFLSRFKTPSEKKKTLKAIRDGELDIVIGTHALLGKGVRFNDLGLLIIDEEHRFGVRHKERIKELKKGVDCLTMSATPIPRTLEMSLSGIREMCLIETPPEERLAVQGMVIRFHDGLIRDAIKRELDRDGQVFFVHNRVGELDGIERKIRTLVPGIKMEKAHGQMKERDLEDVMLRFMNGGIDLLLCTAIIGSGIDVPRANTIIINRADRMGLADLYQLKGRVGRGEVQAYAYFIVPPPEKMSEDARHRIRAIEELNYLGAGLKLALKDLEIRGAGNLLGPEQSGHIEAVGFEMYMEMLSEEVARLKGKPVLPERKPQIDLHIQAYLPEVYVADPSIRLGIYRRLNVCSDEDELKEIELEIRDRFGPPPPEVLNLLDLIRLRIKAMGLGVSNLTLSGDALSVEFYPDTPVDPARLIGLEKIYPGRIRFSERGFKCLIDRHTPLSRGILDFIEDIQMRLAP